MNNEPHRCEKCQSAFGSAYDLKRHIELAHREDTAVPRKRQEALVNAIRLDRKPRAGDWTPEEDQLLRENAHLGLTGCAAAVGRSASSIQNRAAKLHVSLRRAASTAPVGDTSPTPGLPATDPAAWATDDAAQGPETPDDLPTDEQRIYAANEAFALGEADCADEPSEERTFTSRRCRVCGCTDYNACTEDDGWPCHWVEENLCSACASQARPVDFTITNILEPLVPVARADDTRLELIKTYARLALALVRYGSAGEMDEAEAALERIKELAS